MEPSSTTKQESNLEPPFYNISREWYKGKEPFFYASENFASTAIVEANFDAIRAEIMAFYSETKFEIKPNFVPYDYTEIGWKTVNLYTYNWRYGKNCKRFPKIDAIFSKIPNVSMISVSILDPQTEIKAHMGESNTIIRNHLGVIVPSENAEDCGIRVGTETRNWQEGKILSFCDAHRHKAWNHTDKHRVVLVFDLMRPEYARQKFSISGRVLAVTLMKWFTTKWPMLKWRSKKLSTVVRDLLGFGFSSGLWLRSKLGSRA